MHELFTILRTLFPPRFHDQIRLVGGAVRDLLLGRPITDLDLAAALTPETLTSLGFVLVQGKSTSPIWLRHLPESGNIEITPLADMSQLDADLRRRDFTANAISMSLSGDFHDPLGGRDDLEHRQLRPCSNSTFTDDPIRMFRAFRFAADGWELTTECALLLHTNSGTSRLADMPVERFSREMLKALGNTSPERFFLLMCEYSAGIPYLPELFHMAKVPAGPLVHHPEGNLLTHSLQVLQRTVTVTTAPLTRFCAFFHDLGKLSTPPALYPRHHGHEETGYRTAPEFCRRLKLPAEYGRSLAWSSRLHGKLHRWGEMRDSTKLLTAEQALRAGIEDILLQVALADKEGGCPPEQWQQAIAVAALSSHELTMDQAALERIKPEQRKVEVLKRKVEVYRASRTCGV